MQCFHLSITSSQIMHISNKSKWNALWYIFMISGFMLHITRLHGAAGISMRIRGKNIIFQHPACFIDLATDWNMHKMDALPLVEKYLLFTSVWSILYCGRASYFILNNLASRLLFSFEEALRTDPHTVAHSTEIFSHHINWTPSPL